MRRLALLVAGCLAACAAREEPPPTTGRGGTLYTTASCDALVGDDACGACLEGACCAELLACDGDAACAQCWASADPTAGACADDALVAAVVGCAEAQCGAPCAGTPTAPTTLTTPPPTTPTTPAPTGQCARFCCDDGDCGGGTCSFALVRDQPVGVCMDGALGFPFAACDAPWVSPSGGACGSTVQPCNAVTNDGCDQAGGEVCDIAGPTTFECFPPPNEAGLCAPCDNDVGPFCAAGMTCLQP